MKGRTSRDRFDERRRYTGVGEQMGAVRLDSDANELAEIARTADLRRSADLAEGSPDDGFAPALTHLIDPIGSLSGWSVTGLPAGDERLIRTELGLVRRDPETLPRVVRVRGVTAVERTLPTPLDLLHLPVPLAAGATYAASALVLPVRFVWPRGDDEVVATRVLLRAADGTELLVDAGLAPQPGDGTAPDDTAWLAVRVDALAALPRTPRPDGSQAALLAGWGLAGLPPRAQVLIGSLLADPNLPESDVILRGGDGTLAGAGRLYTAGRRSFIEDDWRYSLQPDLPDPQPLVRPAPTPLADGTDGFASHLLYLDTSEVEVHAFQDSYIAEAALDAEDPTFRTRQLTQIRAVLQDPDGRGLPPRDPGLASPISAATLTTNIARGALPDRFPVEQADPCRDACLATENASTGEGYTGSGNLHVRIEVLGVESGGDADAGPRVIGWSRNNAATVAPLRADAPAGAVRVLVDPDAVRRFRPGDVVVVEDRRSRLDPGPRHFAALRRLRAVDSSEGVLEFEPAGHNLTADPQPLPAGGGLPRDFQTEDAAAVRRWDGADWLVPGVRYALADGLTWAFSNPADAARLAEYWTFTARVIAADGAARGVVEQLTDAPVRGPVHVRTPIGRVVWSAAGREVVDLRRLYLPLADVRDRLVELGRRRISPGAFTLVVGDGVTTFGDVDQNLAEGITGDEAIQAAVDLLGADGGTIYIRKGNYLLEHPVLLTGRSNIRLLGDGDATVLRVTGAGGAFHLDWCGHAGGVSVELMRLVEEPAAAPPFGAGALGGVGGVAVGLGGPQPPALNGALGAAIPLLPADLAPLPGLQPDLVDQLAGRIRILDPFAGRAGASVVRTVTELRRLQRLHPGQPLEDVAPDQLAVLNSIPHGVVTVTDCADVTLERLDLAGSDPGDSPVPHAGVLLSGTLTGVAVRDCQITARTGVLALPYARYLLPVSLLLRPRAGLQVDGLVIEGNRLRPVANGPAGIPVGDFGVRVADGTIAGLTVSGNDVAGFALGMQLEDQAEQRFGEPVDRTVVRENRIDGASATGITVTGDGIEVADNEVRMGPAPANPGRLRAGVRVAGVACRVRGNWVTFPGASGPLVLGVEAGVVVGDGLDLDPAGQPPRPVLDVEVSGNRIAGAGAAGSTTGVLVGGPQPVSQVSVTGNQLRDLGGAGVRAWGYLAMVAELTVSGNAIQAVGLADLAWTPAHVAAAAALAPDVALGGATTPRDVLDLLLTPGAGERRPGIDGVLCWLEQASLRGGVVLDLVDGGQVVDNRIADVGTRTQAQPVAVPDAPVQTAGIAVVGGSEISVRGNTVERVRGVVVVTQLVPIDPPRFRPPVLDLLRQFDTLDPGAASHITAHGAVVAVRRQLMEYAAGNQATRQRLGGRVYAAMDAVANALGSAGPAAEHLAVQLAAAVDSMRGAQGTAAHTRAANLTRAVLSDAAALTAAAPDTAAAWEQAAKFDHAVLGEREDIVAAAGEVAQAAPTLLTGLEELNLDVAAQAQTVVAGNTEAALTLADTLGTVAEARARAVAQAQAIPPGGPTVRDTTLLTGTVNLALAEIDKLGPVVEEAALTRIGHAGDALAATLDTANTELAARLRADVGTAVASNGAAPDLQALTTTLRDVQRFAADPASAQRVRPGDVAGQQARFDAELAILTADGIRRQVDELALDPAADAARGMRLLASSTSQLVNLVADRPESVREHALVADREVAAAVSDPQRREDHRAAARAALQSLSDELAQISGAVVTAAAPEQDPASTDVAPRLAALGGLLADFDSVADDGVRDEAVQLLTRGVQRTAEVLGMGPDERASLLSRLGSAGPALGRGEPAGAAVVAGLLDELADRAARADDAPPQALTTRTLIGALNRASAFAAQPADRLLSLQRWVASSADTLSPQSALTISAAVDLPTAMSSIHSGLVGLLPLPGFVPRPRPLPERREPQPADGMFAAGVSARLAVSGNGVRTVRAGTVVAGSSAHPLAPLPDGDGVALSVSDNQVVGAVVVGMDIRPAGTSQVDVVGNEISGCAGLAEAGDRAPTGAVVVIVGTGQLVLARNRLRGNGDQQWARLLHEVALDWRGDVTVTDNVIRHIGAGAGGAGLLVLTDPISGDLVRRLALEPALTVEPATPVKPVPGFSAVNEIPSLLAAGLADRVDKLSAASAVGVGSFRISAAQDRPLIEKLQLSPAVPVAGMAAAEVAHFQRLDTAAVSPLLETIWWHPPVFRPPFLPARRAVHITGNDVVAAGPALLVLADGPNLASVTVVGNELESAGAVGAVYLRNVDTTVFATNRCECLPGVNVAVLRGRKSVLTVTGNVVLGGQPAVPPPHPLPPIRPLGLDPEKLAAGGLTLSVAVGPEATLSVPLDAAAMLEVLDRPATTVYADRAAEAEVRFGQFARRADVTVDPRIRSVLATGAAGMFTLAGGVAGAGGAGAGEAPVLRARLERAPGLGLMRLARGIGGPAQPVAEAAQPAAGAAQPVDAAGDGGLVGHAVGPDAAGHVDAAAANVNAAAAGDVAADQAVSVFLDTTNAILDAPELDGVAKLFGVATAVGMTTAQARTLVHSQLTAAGGNADVALARGLAGLTGVENISATATPAAATTPNLLEGVLGLALRSKNLGSVVRRPPLPRPPVPPPVDPRTRSLVVLGGARVGVLNNITSAGVLVQDAGQTVENNL